ncbi:MAG: sugar ABC transporter substrate-binding protein [Candidatus Atribacteria bacterium]|nr:sugar ABC transporter substrate-binding protein [Candidatus Atribacteria bacterium]
MKRMKTMVVLTVITLLVLSLTGLSRAQEVEKSKLGWPLPPDAKKYAGTVLNCIHESSQPSVTMAKYISDFEEATGIKVNMELTKWDEVFKKTSLDLAGGTGTYDEFYLEGEIRSSFVEAGYVEKLNPLIEKKGITSPEFSLDMYIPECVWGMGVYPPDSRYSFKSINGDLYALPFDNAAMLLFYRKDLFDDPKLQEAFKNKYGQDLAVPVTWDDYQKVAEFFTKKYNPDSPTEYGTAEQMKRHDAMTCHFLNYLFSFGGGIFDDQGNVVFNSPVALEALNYYINMKNYSPPGVTTYTWDEAASAMLEGLVAMEFQWNEFAPVFDDPEKSKVVGKIFYTVPPMKIKHAPAGGGAGSAMSKFSKNKEATWLFIQWMCSNAVQNQIVRDGCPTATVVSAFDNPEFAAKATDPTSPLRQLPAMKEAMGVRAYRPRVPQWPQINEIIFINLSDALAGTKTPEEALSNAAAQIKVSIGQK